MAAALTHGPNNRKPDSTKKIGTPISIREYTRPDVAMVVLAGGVSGMREHDQQRGNRADSGQRRNALGLADRLQATSGHPGPSTASLLLPAMLVGRAIRLQVDLHPRNTGVLKGFQRFRWAASQAVRRARNPAVS